MRTGIWRDTLIIVAGYFVAIFASDRLISRFTVLSRPLELALAFGVVQSAGIAAMLIALFGWKLRDTMRSRRSARLAPQIEHALALHCIGEDQTERLKLLRDESSGDVRARLFMVAATTRGEARARMASLARDLQYVERRVGGGLHAIRERIRVSRTEDFEEIIAWTAGQPLLARAIVADELAPYAGEISDEQIALALSSPDQDVVLTALAMLRAWQRVVRVPGFQKLLASRDARVLAAAFSALSYVELAGQASQAVTDAIVEGLLHTVPSVRAAAANAAGRLGILSAGEALAACLNDPSRLVAVTAAAALATFGPIGMSILERLLASSNRLAAAVAFEAWEKASMGRLELT